MTNNKLVVPEGHCFLLPSRVPHSPQRPAHSVGLVFERAHPDPADHDGYTPQKTATRPNGWIRVPAREEGVEMSRPRHATEPLWKGLPAKRKFSERRLPKYQPMHARIHEFMSATALIPKPLLNGIGRRQHAVVRRRHVRWPCRPRGSEVRGVLPLHRPRQPARPSDRSLQGGQPSRP